MNLHHGSCLCGEVNYQLNADKMKVINCHCNFCRAHSGAAFSTYAALPSASLEFTKGKENLRVYQTGEGEKHFCSICGTPIFNLINKYPNASVVYLGTLKTVKDITPTINIWCESKLDWVDTIFSIPSLAQGIERKNTSEREV